MLFIDFTCQSSTLVHHILAYVYPTVTHLLQLVGPYSHWSPYGQIQFACHNHRDNISCTCCILTTRIGSKSQMTALHRMNMIVAD